MRLDAMAASAAKRHGMIFEQIATGGCQSYLVGCEHTCTAAVIDPEISQIDRYLELAAHGLRIRSVIDTHTCCEFGRISTPAAATLHVMGFSAPWHWRAA
jgi:uncharacterized metal-binding protein